MKGGTYTLAYGSTGTAWTVAPIWEGSGTQYLH